MTKEFERSHEATKITLGKVSSWEELNAATLEEAGEKFKEATKKYWKEFAVSGVLQFDPKEGKVWKSSVSDGTVGGMSLIRSRISRQISQGHLRRFIYL